MLQLEWELCVKGEGALEKKRAEKEIQLEERSRGRQNDQLLIT